MTQSSCNPIPHPTTHCRQEVAPFQDHTPLKQHFCIPLQDHLLHTQSTDTLPTQAPQVTSNPELWTAKQTLIHLSPHQHLALPHPQKTSTTNSTKSMSAFSNSNKNISTITTTSDRQLRPCLPISYNETLLKRIHGCPHVQNPQQHINSTTYKYIWRHMQW